MDILVEEYAGSLWVAALDKKKKLQGLEVDPAGEEVRWGSIYWAKVARIDKSLDAAFVNLDGDNIGLINNADVMVKQKDGSYKRGGDVEIGKVLTPGEMIAVQAKNSYLPKGEDDAKGTAGDKNPRVSMNIALPGRYTIYAPFEGENTISRRITDKKVRDQMMDMLKNIDDGCKGCILRAAAANTQGDIIKREAKLMAAMWGQIQDYLEGDDPCLIMEGPSALQRALSDNSDRSIGDIEVTTMEHFQLVEEWCEIYAPDLVPRIKPIELEDAAEAFALFDHYDLTGQIEDLFQPYAIMPGGSTIIIEETAALTAIDVNSGADDRSRLNINIDAAAEIARQIRLRNLGGIIMIDFLKVKAAEQKKVKEALEKEIARDPCTVQIHGFTGLGLLELARHRRTPPLQERFESAM